MDGLLARLQIVEHKLGIVDDRANAEMHQQTARRLERIDMRLEQIESVLNGRHDLENTGSSPIERRY